jgi:DNA mismatch endonuclease, patch repair protein
MRNRPKPSYRRGLTPLPPYAKPDAVRSRTMAAVRSRYNISTELRFIALLRQWRISGWRRHVALKGRPDFSLPKQQIAIFLDGCQWHGCPRCYRAPLSNGEYWKAKINRNRDRDRWTNRQLRKQGWTVVRFWEHELANESNVRRRLARSGVIQ